MLLQRMMPSGPDYHSIASDEEFVNETSRNLDTIIGQEPPSLPPPPSMFIRGIVYDDRLSVFNERTVEELQMQLYLRGIEYRNEADMEGELKVKGKGKKLTYKQYLLKIVKENIDNGSWMIPVSEDVEDERKRQFKSGGKGIVRRAFDSAGSTAVDVGKVALRELGKGETDAVISRFTG